MADGRYAPSPTSDLHVGNLRTACVAWLLARSTGSRFTLRIDDLDVARVNAAPGVAQRQVRDLRRLGIEWDEVIVQSERTALYAEELSRLPTYPCFCTRKDIQLAVSAPHSGEMSGRYPHTCRDLSARQRSERALVRPAALRLDAREASATAHDRWLGSLTQVVDDIVVRRNDGAFGYHLTSVVDDGLMQIAEVCRGDDLWEVSPQQSYLATELGYAAPTYAHCGLVLSPAGKRLAKRDGAVTLDDIEQHGRSLGDVLGWMAKSLDIDVEAPASVADLLDGFTAEQVLPMVFSSLPELPA